MCGKEHVSQVELPDGWSSDDTIYVGSNSDGVLCPKHAPIRGFIDSQCPGCVGGWGDCGLWRSMHFPKDDPLTERDMGRLHSGICPKRVNGTLVMDRRGPDVKIEDVDLSERAPDGAGPALVAAIAEYFIRESAE